MAGVDTPNPAKLFDVCHKLDDSMRGGEMVDMNGAVSDLGSCLQLQYNTPQTPVRL